jgi:hypothetical protein
MTRACAKRGVCGGYNTPCSRQVVGKILNPSRQNMNLDRKKKKIGLTPIKNDS